MRIKRLIIGLLILLSFSCDDGQDDAVKGVNNDASLESLAVSAGTLTPDFSPETMTYTVDLPYSESSITITGTVTDPEATLSSNSGQSRNLDLGANTITISVTARDGITGGDYVVTVNRDRAQWARTVSSENMSEFCSVSVDSNGNVYVAGGQVGTGTYIYGTGVTATGSYGGGNVVLVKYNSSGIAQWARTVSSGSDLNKFNSVSTDSSGNVYAAGYQEGTGSYNYGNNVTAAGSSSNKNVVLVKYNSSGSAQWAMTVSSGTIGSSFRSVSADTNGNVYAAGYQEGTGSYNYGNNVTAAGSSSSKNVVLVKYNSSGTAQWATTVSSGLEDSEFYSVSVDSTGNVYEAGYQDGTGSYNYGNNVTAAGISSASNLVLVKYNSSGTAQWARTVSTGSSSGGSDFSSVFVDPGGNVYAVGSQYGTGTTYTYGNNVTAAGTAPYNSVLVKYSNAGTAQWARTIISGSSHNEFYSVSADSAGNIFVVGYQLGIETNTYGTGVTATGTSSLYNMVLVKYNSTGTAQWARTIISGSDHHMFFSVTADSVGNVYAAGYQYGSGTYTYGTGVTATGTSVDDNVILVKYAQ